MWPRARRYESCLAEKHIFTSHNTGSMEVHGGLTQFLIVVGAYFSVSFKSAAADHGRRYLSNAQLDLVSAVRTCLV